MHDDNSLKSTRGGTRTHTFLRTLDFESNDKNLPYVSTPPVSRFTSGIIGAQKPVASLSQVVAFVRTYERYCSAGRRAKTVVTVLVLGGSEGALGRSA